MDGLPNGEGTEMKKIFGMLLMMLAGVVAAQTSWSPVSGLPVSQPSVQKAANSLPSASLGQLTGFMATQLAGNWSNKTTQNVSDTRVAVASFVDIDDLGRASLLGMQVAENLMHEMHIRGFGIVDFKTRDALKIGSTGDLVFSRDIADLRREYRVHYFLSGTITLNADGAVFNARLIDAASSLVVSTAQGFLSKRDLHRVLNGESTVVSAPKPPAYTVVLR